MNVQNKSRQWYYATREDYDASYTVGKKTVRCFSKKQLDKMYPDGEYAVVGETGENLKNDKKNIGLLEIARVILPVNRFGQHSKFYKAVKFVQVGQDEFIALLEFRAALVLIPSAIAIIAAVVVALVLILGGNSNVQEPDPMEEDPYIKPVEPDSTTVSGTVTLGGKAYEGATVVLLAGEKEVAKTTTDKAGAYLFNKVESGAYTVMATVGKSSLSKGVAVIAIAVKADFNFPDLGENGVLNARVKLADTNTPNISVGELDKEALIYAENNKQVDLTFIPKKYQSGDAPKVETTAITNKSGELELTYFDFSLLKEVSSKGVVESSEYLSTTQTVFEVIIPYSSAFDVATHVFRSVDGVAQQFENLSARPTGNFKDGTVFVDKSGSFVYIYVNKMGTFAIGSARAQNKIKGSAVVGYSDSVTVNLKTGVIEMMFEHGSSSTTNARVQLYLVGEKSNVLISQSGIVPAGNKLETMVLKSGITGMPGVGSYEGLMKILYVGESTDTADTNVDIPVTVTLVNN